MEDTLRGAEAQLRPALRYLLFPTLFWLPPLRSNAGIQWSARAGAAMAIAGALGIVPVTLAVGIATVMYLSVISVGGDFFGLQWDALLIEVGLLCTLSGWAHPLLAALAFRWLLFRLLFGSGVCKLASGCPLWRSRDAIRTHLWTQPLPHLGAWLASQLPVWFLHGLVDFTLLVELFLPLLFLLPIGDTATLGCFIAVTVLMLGIMGTGSFGFFNTLTVVIAVVLLPDHAAVGVARLARATRWSLATDTGVVDGGGGAVIDEVESKGTEITKGLASAAVAAAASTLLLLHTAVSVVPFRKCFRLTKKRTFWHAIVEARTTLHLAQATRPQSPGKATAANGTATGAGAITGWRGRLCDVAYAHGLDVAYWVGQSVPDSLIHRIHTDLWPTLERCHVTTGPLRICNAYGLFARMSAARHEVVIERSDDGEVWTSVRWLCKPGDLSVTEANEGLPAPCWVGLPRLDWRLWFLGQQPRVRMAQLGVTVPMPPWFTLLCQKILKGDRAIAGLLHQSEQDMVPCAMLRVRYFRYCFAPRGTGATWSREAVCQIGPVLERSAVAASTIAAAWRAHKLRKETKHTKLA